MLSIAGSFYTNQAFYKALAFSLLPLPPVVTEKKKTKWHILWGERSTKYAIW